MLTNPRVSVVIPAFNCKKFIASAVKSVIEQSHKNVEIIIVDDASTDGTYEEVTSLKKLFPQVILISNNRTKGPSGARNTGLSIASGEYVAFLDADDIWLPNHLDGVRFLEENKDVDVVFFNFNIVDFNTGQVVEDWFSARKAPRVLSSRTIAEGYKLITDDMFRALVVESFMHLQSMLLRSELCKTILFNESINRSEDRDFAVRIFMDAGGVFAYSENITGVYYIHGGSLTSPGLANELVTIGAHIKIFTDYLSRCNVNENQKSVLKKSIFERYLAGCYANRMAGRYVISILMSMYSLRYGFSIKPFVEFFKTMAVMIFIRKN